MSIHMKDNYGRDITYLRVSVTKRCNLNCIYCGKDFCAKKEQELSANTFCKIINAFAACGIRKVRFTGGEPLVRQDICEMIETVSVMQGITELSLTTNGVLLGKYAQALKQAGLQSVNISLDTLDREKYMAITGTDALGSVMDGIQAAQAAGLRSIKINAVLMKDINADEAGKLITIAEDNEIDVRFIELMPFSVPGSRPENIITGTDLLRQFPKLRPLPEQSGTAVYYARDGWKGRIGFINPISHKFCAQCNRIRLLSDGKVKPCLGYDTAYDILPYLDDEQQLTDQIETIIKAKPAAHSFDAGLNPAYGLNNTGG